MTFYPQPLVSQTEAPTSGRDFINEGLTPKGFNEELFLVFNTPPYSNFHHLTGVVSHRFILCISILGGGVGGRSFPGESCIVRCTQLYPMTFRHMAPPLAWPVLSLPLTCFRSVAIASSHIGLSLCPSEGSLIRFRGQSLLLSWRSGFMEWESRDTIRAWQVGDTKPPLDPANVQKWLQLLGHFSDLLMAYCWTFLTTILLTWQGISISWPSQMPFCVQWSTLNFCWLRFPLISERHSFGQSLFKRTQANILMMDMNPSFSLGSWDLTLLLKGTALLSKAASTLSPRAASDSICLSGILRHGADISPECLSVGKNLPLHETWGEGNTVPPFILTPTGEVSIRSSQRNFH